MEQNRIAWYHKKGVELRVEQDERNLGSRPSRGRERGKFPELVEQKKDLGKRKFCLFGELSDVILLSIFPHEVFAKPVWLAFALSVCAFY